MLHRLQRAADGKGQTWHGRGPDLLETQASPWSPRPTANTTMLVERSVVLLLVGLLLLGVALVLRPFATAILFALILAVATWPLRLLLVRAGLSPRLAAHAAVARRADGDRPADACHRRRAWLRGLPREHVALKPPSSHCPASRRTGSPQIPLAGAPLTGLWSRRAAAAVTCTPCSSPMRTGCAERPGRGACAGGQCGAIPAGDHHRRRVLGEGRSARRQPCGTWCGAWVGDRRRGAGGCRRRTGSAPMASWAGLPPGDPDGDRGPYRRRAGAGRARLPRRSCSPSARSGAVLLPLVWGGAAWWLFHQGDQGWGIFMLAWGLVLVSPATT